MSIWQFQSQLNPDHTVNVPPDVAAQLRPDEKVRVVLVVGDSNEEADWNRIATEQFLNGYGLGDEIYDQLSPG